MVEESHTLTIGVPTETFPGERRVALVPSAVPALAKAGAQVILEPGAGMEAGFPDQQYADKGASFAASREELFQKADVILQVRAAGANPAQGVNDFPRFKPGQVVIAHCDPLSEPQAIAEIAAKQVKAFSLEMLPRITRAQSMDVLSSMATIAGYKCVLLAADTLPRMFPMMMTAAGTITPARVFIMGAGVAGLQAIATARRLGSLVSAYDVRDVVKEQVESLGAKFVVLDLETGTSETKGGYAKEMGEEFYRRQRELLTEVIAEQNVVITTAAIPGRKAPILVTEEMVKAMAPGSVIVDLAAERGGNCELTVSGQTTVVHDVTILGPENIPSTIPYHASEMFSKNISTFLLHLISDGKIAINLDDEIHRDTLLTSDGEVVHTRIRELLNLPSLETETPQEPAANETANSESAESENPRIEETETVVDSPTQADNPAPNPGSQSPGENS